MLTYYLYELNMFIRLIFAAFSLSVFGSYLGDHNDDSESEWHCPHCNLSMNLDSIQKLQHMVTCHSPQNQQGKYWSMELIKNIYMHKMARKVWHIVTYVREWTWEDFKGFFNVKKCPSRKILFWYIKRLSSIIWQSTHPTELPRSIFISYIVLEHAAVYCSPHYSTRKLLNVKRTNLLAMLKDNLYMCVAKHIHLFVSEYSWKQ
jgi:hypothetical protein